MNDFRFPPNETRRLLLQAIPERLNALDDLSQMTMAPYLPAPHARALDLRTPLVEGIRGSGKSFWWNILQSPEMRQQLARQTRHFSIPESVEITVGFGENSRPLDYPDKSLLIQLALKFSLEDIWRAIIAHHLLDDDLMPILSSWEERLRWIGANRHRMETAFHEQNERLQQQQKIRLILFDALDRTADDWRTMRRIVQGLFKVLLEFRSFQAIYTKAFVRSDLLTDPWITAFPDSSKLMANRNALLWPPRELYNLLWHLLANAPEGGALFRHHCQDQFNLEWTPNGTVWPLPQELRINESLQQSVFHAITGPFMTQDRKRGTPHGWLTNHLEDGLRQVSPRSFLAALREAASGDPLETAYPLSGADIQRGVYKASEIRVQEIAEDYPWVTQLMTPLKGMIIPAPFQEMKACWEKKKTLDQLKEAMYNDGVRQFPQRLEKEGADGVGKELEELGVFQMMRDGGVNLPDVYRIGYGMRRKGSKVIAVPTSTPSEETFLQAEVIPAPAPWNGLLILHLSDLHFGDRYRFAAMQPEELGQRTAASVKEILPKDRRLDLVIVTGDITEHAKPPEFDQAFACLSALAGAAGITRDQFVFLPGNHDVSWSACKRIELDLDELNQLADDPFFQRTETEKFQPYETFLTRFIPDPRHIQPLDCGARLWDFPRLRLSVAALNSNEKITHRPGEKEGHVSAKQVESVLAHWQETTDRIKILALHHNPEGGPQLQFPDKDHLKNLVKQSSPHILLSGHQHADSAGTSWAWQSGGAACLLGAGSLGGNQDTPRNTCQLLAIDPQGVLKIRPLEYNPQFSVAGKADPGRFVTVGGEKDYPETQLSLPAKLSKTTTALPKPQSDRHKRFLTAYRERLTETRPRWDLSQTGVALAVGTNPERAALNDMYLPLRLGENTKPDILDAGAVLPPTEVMNLKEPMIIRGQAGAGKTTWIRWTFHKLIQNSGTLPILVELRSLAVYWQKATQEQRSLDAYLVTWMKEQGLGGWADELGVFLQDPGTIKPVLLVDGWDELGELGHDFRQKLQGFLNAHRNVRCVVTSRPYGAGRPTGSDGFSERIIQPLNDDEIQDLVTRFFRHALAGPDAARDSAMFMASLGRSVEATQMARTALLLTLMLLISRTSPLPEKRVRLYQKCVETLLETLPDKRKEKGGLIRAEAWTHPDATKRLRSAAALAYAVQSARGSEDDARAPIARTHDELVQFLQSEEMDAKQASGFVVWLLDSAGILMERADNRLQFIHLSFQEFLASYHLNTTVEGDAPRSTRFHELAQNPSWWETLRLWAALIDERNPLYLEPVLQTLVQDPKKGLHLAGIILADGLGRAEI
ncbi:MAG: metallophosphoesterase [Magnetococcales bacterium]|nr:metallophosphoesterase [Magnetococcales bacterium]